MSRSTYSPSRSITQRLRGLDDPPPLCSGELNNSNLVPIVRDHADMVTSSDSRRFKAESMARKDASTMSRLVPMLQ